MTEELQGALTEILNGVLSTRDFMLAELPEVVQQLLLWKFCQYFIYCFAGIILSILCYWGMKKTWAWMKKDASGLEPIILFWAFPLVFIGLELLNIKWLQIWLAPKVYLIEYATSLAK